MIDRQEINDWTISACEVYWEFSVIDALSFVNDLWNGFQTVLYNTERRDFTPDRQNGESLRSGRLQQNNGIAIYADDFGIQDLKLVVYAKLHNRVRFELRYNRSLLRYFSGNRRNNINTGTSDGFFLALSMYKADMQKRLKKIVRAMPDLALTERSEFSVLADFLYELSEAHKDIPNVSVRRTISMLLHSNRVIAPQGSHDETVMRRLAKRNIVHSESPYPRNDNRNKIYRRNQRYYELAMNFRRVFEEPEG